MWHYGDGIGPHGTSIPKPSANSTKSELVRSLATTRSSSDSGEDRLKEFVDGRAKPLVAPDKT